MFKRQLEKEKLWLLQSNSIQKALPNQEQHQQHSSEGQWRNDKTTQTWFHVCQMMVSELKEELFNPILVFKSQGSQDPGFPTLSAETFVLAIQTQFQMELYRQYATTILCIDSTHGTNQYRFKLITCIVHDHGKGWRAEGNVRHGYL